MNPPPNLSAHQGEASWVTQDTWEHTPTNTNQYQSGGGGAGGGGGGGGGGSRPEWEWDNQMLLVQQSTDGVPVERKPQLLVSLPTATVCNRPYSSNYSVAAAIPQGFLQQHHNILGTSFTAPSGAVRSSYGGLEGYQNHQGGVALHAGLVPSYGQEAATPTDLNAELRSYEQRRRFLGMQMLDPEQNRNVLDFVKREDMYSLGEHARIGLNLGGRTYFSAEDSRLGKRSRSITHAPICQVQGCTADLGKAKHYHRRHKVCEVHSKAPNVIASGQTQRFCQQCSRFHQLSEFDDTKRSCRKRLADHNRRRRKPQPSAVVTLSEPYKAEEQSTNIRPTEGDHKPMLMHMQKSGSPTASITDRDSISSGANRLQDQSPTYRTMEEKLVNTVNNTSNSSRESLLRNHQAIPSSHVQALVLSVVSRTPSAAQLTTRQPAATQESVYQQYLQQGPSLSLSSAGMSEQNTHNNTQSSRNFNSVEQSIPWLGSSYSTSRSSLVQARPLQAEQSEAFQQSSSRETGQQQQQLQVGVAGSSNPHHFLQPSKSSAWLIDNTPREQLGRLGFQSFQGGSMDGRQMLALIENPGHHHHHHHHHHQHHQQQQQLNNTVHDVKPLQQSEMQNSVRSSFGSSFYDSSSSIG